MFILSQVVILKDKLKIQYHKRGVYVLSLKIV